MASKYYREIWVPPENRDIQKLKQNTGTSPEDLFVWFPKKTLKTEDGYDIHYMEIPIGAHLYRGLSPPRGYPIPCDKVDDPSNPGCKLCNDAAWYSDRQTALYYANNNPSFLYDFEVTTPLKLVNLTDKRNLDIIHARIRTLVEDPEYKVPELPPDEGSPIFGQQPTSYNASDDAPQQMKTLYVTTGYSVDIKEPIFNPYRSEFVKEDPPKGIADPPVPPQQTEEFGDQSVLSRFSSYLYDPSLVAILKIHFERYGIHGYYSPTYKSDRLADKKEMNYYFPREICLFKSKNLVRHAKESPFDGCKYQTGTSRKTRRRRKLHT